MVSGMFLTLRRVRETLKLGLRSLVFFSSAARLRRVLSVADMLSQAVEPSSITPSFACQAQQAALSTEKGEAAMKQCRVCQAADKFVSLGSHHPLDP